MTIALKHFTQSPNAKDVASQAIVAHVTNHSVRVIGQRDTGSSNLIAIGSILHWADESSFVWGAGLISAAVRVSLHPKEKRSKMRFWHPYNAFQMIRSKLFRASW